MRTSNKPSLEKDSLSVKLGGWFEAQATGWGVLAIPIIILIVAVAAVLRLIVFR